MTSIQEIQQAKDLLKKAGYYTDNMWTIHDVMSIFNCSEQEAQEVLDEALTNEATIEQVWFSIREFDDIFNLEEKDV